MFSNIHLGTTTRRHQQKPRDPISQIALVRSTVILPPFILLKAVVVGRKLNYETLYISYCLSSLFLFFGTMPFGPVVTLLGGSIGIFKAGWNSDRNHFKDLTKEPYDVPFISPLTISHSNLGRDWYLLLFLLKNVKENKMKRIFGRTAKRVDMAVIQYTPIHTWYEEAIGNQYITAWAWAPFVCS